MDYVHSMQLVKVGMEYTTVHNDYCKYRWANHIHKYILINAQHTFHLNYKKDRLRRNE